VNVPAAGTGERAEPPTVTIGLPAYNGEPYIEEAIDSILGQTFADFELLVVDNRSTDRTVEICQTYAARDPRVRCIRQRQNFGYIENFNTAFRLSSGRYFKWAACDDVLAPEFLRRAVEVLDGDPSVVLAYPVILTIDEDGRPNDIRYRGFDRRVLERTASPDPAERFSATMRNLWYTDHLYGLIRSDSLASTRLHARHFIGDHILLSELSLQGRFERIPEPLLFLRRHASQTSRAPSARQRLGAVGGAPRGVPAPAAVAWQYPRRLLLHASAVHRTPLTSATRARAYLGLLGTVLRWAAMRLRGAAAAGLPGRDPRRLSPPASSGGDSRGS
jgi:glycosyltransferase involved in cell wall biosynthesis